jgi:hypothetical protein
VLKGPTAAKQVDEAVDQQRDDRRHARRPQRLHPPADRLPHQQRLPRGDDTIAFSVPPSDDIKVSINEAKVRTFNETQKRVIDSIDR